MSVTLDETAKFTPLMPTDPTRLPKSGSGEEALCQLLKNLGVAYEYEPETFPLEYRPDGDISLGFTPDFKLPATAARGDLYLEETGADRYDHARKLPSAVRRKNRHHSRSRRSFISPAEYVRLKRQKIRRAESIYGIKVILVTGHLLDQIEARPQLLLELIDAAASSHILPVSAAG